MKAENNLCIGQIISLSMINKFSPEKVILSLCKQSTVKGLRYYTNSTILPIIELNDQTRIWILPKEIARIHLIC
jgi:hypothetical protein